MQSRTTLLSGSLLGGLAVAFGAFGTHALKASLLATGRLEVYETAVRYQLFHSLALLLVGILIQRFPGARLAGNLFAIGTIIFSGTLYALALSNQGWWGAITPLGGIALIGGWMTLAWTVYRSKD